METPEEVRTAICKRCNTLKRIDRGDTCPACRSEMTRTKQSENPYYPKARRKKAKEDDDFRIACIKINGLANKFSERLGDRGKEIVDLIAPFVIQLLAAPEDEGEVKNRETPNPEAEVVPNNVAQSNNKKVDPAFAPYGQFRRDVSSALANLGYKSGEVIAACDKVGWENGGFDQHLRDALAWLSPLRPANEHSDQEAEPEAPETVPDSSEASAESTDAPVKSEGTTEPEWTDAEVEDAIKAPEPPATRAKRCWINRRGITMQVELDGLEIAVADGWKKGRK